MSRSQQNETYNTAQSQNQTNEANAQKSEAAEQADITNEQSQLAKFAANNPYMQGGEYQTAQNQSIAGAADASAAATRAAEQNIAGRSGSNPQAAVAAAEAAGQNAQRTAATDQGDANTQRISSKSAYDQQALSDQNSITGQQEQLAALQSGAANSALNTQEQAAQQPSFLDQLSMGLVQAGGQVGSAAVGAYCPTAGTLYLMADGTEIQAEKLRVGDRIAGIDGEPQVIEEIQEAIAETIRVATSDGHVVRNSLTHAYALPFGGFTVAVRSLGKRVRTSKGVAQIISVDANGKERVFNVITDGSHTYRADGVWALGVGDAERHTSMDQWGEIGRKLMETEA